MRAIWGYVKKIGYQLSVAFILPLSIVLGGCAGLWVRTTSLEESKALIEENKSVVLARFTAEKDGEPIDVIGSISYLDAYRVVLMNLDTDERQELGPFFISPTHEARGDGWVRFVLDPGSYYIEIHPPIGYATRLPTRSWFDNRFRFTVPNQSSVLYIGSFHAICSSIWGLFGRRLGACSSQLSVTDESEAARAVTATSFGPFGELKTALVRPYDSHPTDKAISDLLPMALAVTGTPGLVPPDWEGLDEEDTPEQPAFLGGGGGSGCYGYGCGLILMAALAIWGVAEIVEQVQALADEGKWGPCVESLEEHIREIDLPSELQHRLVDRLPPASVIALGEDDELSDEASMKGNRSVLRAEVKRVQLRKCREPETLCVELVVRAHIVNPATETRIYDTTYLYSNLSRVPDAGVGYGPSPSHAAWERPISWSSECRNIAAYCGENGRALVKKELSSGIDFIVTNLIRDLGLGSDMGIWPAKADEGAIPAEELADPMRGLVNPDCTSPSSPACW